jgi:hypothetical protein
MPYKGYKSITLPEDIVNEMKKYLEENKEELRRRHIKKISHVVEEAWYFFKEVNLMGKRRRLQTSIKKIQTQGNDQILHDIDIKARTSLDEMKFNLDETEKILLDLEKDKSTRLRGEKSIEK